MPSGKCSNRRNGSIFKSMLAFPLAAGRLLRICLFALQGSGHQHGACGDQRTRGARVQHALAGVLCIPSACALRGAAVGRKAVHLLALFPVCLVSGFANEEMHSHFLRRQMERSPPSGAMATRFVFACFVARTAHKEAGSCAEGAAVRQVCALAVPSTRCGSDSSRFFPMALARGLQSARVKPLCG